MRLLIWAGVGVALALVCLLLVRFVPGRAAQAASCLGVAGIGYVAFALSCVVERTEPSDAVGADAWAEFTSPEKGFKVLFPGKPVAKREGHEGWKDAFTMYGVELHGGRSGYFVGFGELDDREIDLKKPAEFRFAGAKNGMLQKSPGSELVSEKAMTLHGEHPGREFVFRVPERGNMIVRAFLVDARRFYVVTAAGPDFSLDQPDVERFFNSFGLLSKEIPPANAFPGILAYWTFDDADGMEATDVSKARLTAKLSGTRPTKGVRGKAVYLTNDAHINLGSSGRLNFKDHGAFSVTWWMKPNENWFDRYTPFLSFSNSKGLGQSLSVFADRDRLTATFRSSTNPRNEGVTIRGPRIQQETWSHVAVTRDARNNLTIYLNGEAPVDSLIAAGDLFTDVRFFGQPGGQSYRGSLDELAVFNRALTHDEISSLAGMGPLPDLKQLPPELDFKEEKSSDPYLGKVSTGHASINTLRFLSDKTTLVVADQWGVQLWDWPQRKLIRKMGGKGPVAAAHRAPWIVFPDSRQLVIYDLQQQKLKPFKFAKLDSNIPRIAVSPDDSQVFVGESDVIRVYSSKTGELADTWEIKGSVRMETSPKGDLLAVSSRRPNLSAVVSIREIKTGNLVHAFDVPGDAAMAFTPDGEKLIAVAGMTS